MPADHRIKLKGSEKKDKYLDLARELEKLWNMKVTIIPIVIGAFGTLTKLLRTARILRIVQRLREAARSRLGNKRTQRKP